MFSLDKQADAIESVRHGNVMPLAVADVCSGAHMIGRIAGQEGGEVSRAVVGKDLPVSGGRLGFVGDEDVVARFVGELRPAFDGERRLAIDRLARHTQ